MLGLAGSNTMVKPGWGQKVFANLSWLENLVNWNPAYVGSHATSFGVLIDKEAVKEVSAWPIMITGLWSAKYLVNMRLQSAGESTPNPLEWKNIFLSGCL